MKKLKKRWDVDSNWQLFLIVLVFSITGTVATKLAAPVAELIGVTKEMEWYYYWPLRVSIIFPLYQILLVFFGWIFGQFHFFWKFEKQMLKRMKLGFLINN